LDLPVEVSPVFEKIYSSTKKIVVNEGGTRSGKTWSTLQFLLFVICFKYTGKKISIVRKTRAEIWGSVYEDFIEILKDADLYNPLNENRSHYTYTFRGNLIEFIGLDKAQKKRGAKRDYLFCNEMNDFLLDDWLQLIMRTKERAFIDYNPSFTDHFIYDIILTRDDCELIQSNYEDNRAFLTVEQIKEIERLKDVDPFYWTVYGKGKRADIKGVIYKNWATCDMFPDYCKWVAYGLDFGFTNDPTALIKIGFIHGMLYEEELIYETDMSNRDIIKRLRDFDITRNDEIWADSAEPKDIREIQTAGFNIKGADKGPGSVKHGIQLVQKFKTVIVKSSLNLLKEKKNYKWKEGPDGKPINVPVDRYNHLLDGERYVISMKLGTAQVGSLIFAG